MTDPTPRTAATARERDIYETVREVIRDYTCLPFGLGEAKEMCSRITSALAAAEAPGRVAAELCVWCGKTEDVCRMRNHTFAPAPTPSEPVER